MCRNIEIVGYKQADKASAKELHFIQILVNALAEQVFVKDINGVYVFVNEAYVRSLGLTGIESAIGKNDQDLLPVELAQQNHEKEQEVIRSGKPIFDREYYLRDELSRITKWILSTLLPWRNGKGEIVGVIGINRDITDRRELEKEIVEIGSSERQRIGRDLHDGIGQLLTGIAFLSKTLEGKLAKEGIGHCSEIEQLSKLSRQTLVEMRCLSGELMQVDDEICDITESLLQLATDVEAIFGVKCIVKYDSKIRLDNIFIAQNVYFIVQEAVTNAVKHSRAGNIWINLNRVGKNEILMEVKDDGIGLQKNFDKQNGVGLRTMRHRAGIVGASLDIRSNTGGGTIMRCSLKNDNVK